MRDIEGVFDALTATKAIIPGLSLRAYTPGTGIVGSDVWIQVAGFQPNQGASNNFAPTVGQLIAIPFLPGPSGGVFNAMAFDQIVAGGGGSLTHLGMYTHNPTNGQPNVQVIDCGSVATDGANGVKIMPGNFILPATLHWMVMLCRVAAPTVAGYGAATMVESLLGYAAGVPNAAQVGWNVAFGGTVLPQTWPGGATIRVLSAGVPYIIARLA